VHMKETDDREPLIREATENHNIYLVLSGHLQAYRCGKPLYDDHGTEIIVNAGGIVAELSALSGKTASATVAGKAVVLGISMPVIQQQLKSDPVFRDSMKELAGYRIY
jgi:CRP-like cAMP-binding protein